MHYVNSGNLSKKNTVGLLLITVLLFLSACATKSAENIPSDFYMMMDVHAVDRQTARNINIRIQAAGTVEYDIYETGGVIKYDENDIVTYDQGQIVRDGTFMLTGTQVKRLWEAIEEIQFFELSEKYQMEIGYSYAFILIEANGQTHTVDNIGMEVPEMRFLVETVADLMPDDIEFAYGEGYIP